jgi:group I intron endonuclease
MIIYKVTNLTNGKTYIGQTTRTLGVRKRQHLVDARGKESNLFFHRALLEYGFENFSWEVIFEGRISTDFLNFMEMFWIQYWGSFGEGYNLTCGGDKPPSRKGTKMSDESRKKMSNSRKGSNAYWYGKKRTPDTIAKISASRSGQSPWMKGRHHSDETKSRISSANKGTPSPMKGRHHSEETKIKMSNAKKGKPSPRKGMSGGPAWNKDKTGIYSDETRKNISSSLRKYYEKKRLSSV